MQQKHLNAGLLLELINICMWFHAHSAISALVFLRQCCSSHLSPMKLIAAIFTLAFQTPDDRLTGVVCFCSV